MGLDISSLSMRGSWTVIIVEGMISKMCDFFSRVYEILEGIAAVGPKCLGRVSYPQVWKRLWTTLIISSFLDQRFPIGCMIRMGLSRMAFRPPAKNLDNSGSCPMVIPNLLGTWPTCVDRFDDPVL
jgi:hypothetical protein